MLPCNQAELEPVSATRHQQRHGLELSVVRVPSGVIVLNLSFMRLIYCLQGIQQLFCCLDLRLFLIPSRPLFQPHPCLSL